jgi:hypothetical protein
MTVTRQENEAKLLLNSIERDDQGFFAVFPISLQKEARHFLEFLPVYLAAVLGPSAWDWFTSGSKETLRRTSFDVELNRMVYTLDKHEVSMEQIKRINEDKEAADGSLSSAGIPDDDDSQGNIFEPLHQIHLELPPGLLDEQVERPKDFDTGEEFSLMSNMTGASVTTAGNRDGVAYPTADSDDDDDEDEEMEELENMDTESGASPPFLPPPPPFVHQPPKDDLPIPSDATTNQNNHADTAPTTYNTSPSTHHHDDEQTPNTESHIFSNNGLTDPTTSSATDRSMEE